MFILSGLLVVCVVALVVQEGRYERRILEMKAQRLAELSYYAAHPEELQEVARRIQRAWDLGWDYRAQVQPRRTPDSPLRPPHI